MPILTDTANAVRTLLVSMPWASIRRPNLGLATLSGQLAAAGLPCEVLYPCVSFAAAIGEEAYESLADTPGLFAACEHVFALSLFDHLDLDSQSFLARYTSGAGENPFRKIFEEHVSPFLDRTVEDIVSRNPTVVGFGCTFNQTLASLAVARRLKARRPDMTILFGGGSVHASMGVALARAFVDCIDHVFLGEADRTLPEFLSCLAAKGDVSCVGGITVEGAMTSPPIGIQDLNAVAAPLFDDYFRQLDESGFGRSVVQGIPFESSRGCWWGQKSHCTFCGLNNEGMTFRSKSADRVVDEVVSLSQRYQTTELMAADNILTHTSWNSLLPRLTNLGLDLSIFYEIKANVGRDQVAALARAGIRSIQPGIESFSTPILKLMRKGLTSLQNVMFLRLCREFGLTPIYNILGGFPGETPADYAAMSTLLRKLFHLPPPSGTASLVQVHRFSPFHNEPERLGIGRFTPAWSYRHLIPPAILDPGSYAYFFDRPGGASEYKPHLEAVNEVVREWLTTDRQVTSRLGPGFIEVRDSRHGVLPLSRLESLVMLAADRPRKPSELLRLVHEQSQGHPGDVHAALSALVDRSWVVDDDGMVVNSVPFERPHAERDLELWSERWLDVSPKRLSKDPTNIYLSIGAATVRELSPPG